MVPNNSRRVLREKKTIWCQIILGVSCEKKKLPEARLVLGEGVHFLPGKPEALENAFYLQLELQLERFRVIVEPHIGHLDNGKTAINGRSSILRGRGPLAWHCVAGAWWKRAFTRLSLL